MSETPGGETSGGETPAPRKQGFIRSSIIYAGLTLVSRFMGAARDLVISARVGASLTPAADALNTALAFPNLFRRIFAEGAFSSAFLPAYARDLTQKGEGEADRMAADALAFIAACTIVLTIAAQLAMPWLMMLINPGYVDDAGKYKLAVALTQITMPYLPCMAVAALLSGVLNAHGRFILSAAAPTMWNAAMLIAVIPQHDATATANAASWATLAAGLMQAGALWWGCWKTGAKIRLHVPRLTPEIKQVLKLTIPGTIAQGATTLNIFISQILASHTPGARSWLVVADRFYQLPISLVGVAIGVALLPRLSQAIAAEDKADAQTSMDQALIFAMALALPAGAALASMPYYLVDGLWTRGAFTHEDAAQTAGALFYYGLGVPAFVLNRVLQPAFFARQDTASPMRFGLISVAVNIAAGVALYQVMGVAGIAAATAIASWLSTAQMAFTLARRGHYTPTQAAWGRLIRVTLASAVLGALLAAASHWRAVIEAPLAGVNFAGFRAKEVAILGLSMLGAGLYPFLLFAFGGLTMGEIRLALRRVPGARTADLPGAD
ncbi:MAG: murein biosynthesis integral membrane protein MurJ [Caulobacteraceae bacterium]